MPVLRSLSRMVRQALLSSLVATTALVGSGLGTPTSVRAAAPGAAPSAAQLQALESALNGSDAAALRAQLNAGPGVDPGLIERRWTTLRQQFANARWHLSPGAPDRDGQPTVNLRVTATRMQGSVSFQLVADQLLVLHSDGRVINGETLLKEQSILRSGEAELPVSLLSPDVVLTGQRYDVDVIFDEPLDGALAAGGLLALTPQQVAAMESPSLDLAALGGGGLFKTVQAPYTPGSQTWAVLLVHPKGVITATKRVRVVADKSLLKP